MAIHRGINPQDIRDDSQKKLFQHVESTGKISWGEPAMVAQASCDKRCPTCSTDKRDGFQIEFDGNHCVGIYCPSCGFTFGIEPRAPDVKEKMLFGPAAGGKEIAAIARQRQRDRTKQK
jgi:hypothetical protein